MVTRERLIEASIDVFSHRGFDGTSLSAIAKEAGVAQPTLNYHFGTKRELYQEVIRHCGSKWVAAIQVGDDLRDLTKLDSLKVLLRRLGHVIVDQEVVTRLTDRGTNLGRGIVSDVGLFLEQLALELVADYRRP